MIRFRAGQPTGNGRAALRRGVALARGVGTNRLALPEVRARCESLTRTPRHWSEPAKLPAGDRRDRRRRGA